MFANMKSEHNTDVKYRFSIGSNSHHHQHSTKS